MGKSDKLYKDSPRVEKDEDGKASIRKNSDREAGKEPTPADADDAGLGGVPVQAEEMHGRHESEMKDMHGRHEKEQKDMHKRHMTETKKLHGKEGKE